MKNESKLELYKAINCVQKELSPLDKSADNPYFESKYIPLSGILLKLNPLLVKHSLIMIQSVERDQDGDYLLTKIIHTNSGETLDSKLYLKIDKTSMQALGSAITYARRYSISPIFGVIEKDDDGEQAENFQNFERNKKPLATSKPFNKGDSLL